MFFLDMLENRICLRRRFQNLGLVVIDVSIFQEKWEVEIYLEGLRVSGKVLSFFAEMINMSVLKFFVKVELVGKRILFVDMFLVYGIK